MRYKQGFTLVELMVGLAISMIIILTMMTLFKNTSRSVFGQSGNSSTSVAGLIPSAKQDGQLSTALLTMQNILQSAGYGIDATTNTHLQLISGASLNTSTNKLSGTTSTISASGATGNTIVWQNNLAFADGSSDYTCHGLVSDSLTRAVYLIEAPAPCNSLSTTWNTVAWSKQTLIEPNVLPTAMTFTALSDTGCSPYGISLQASTVTSASIAGLQVNISYANSSVNSSNSYSVCLSNFASAS